MLLPELGLLHPKFSIEPLQLQNETMMYSTDECCVERKHDKITICVANATQEGQTDLSLMLPIISQDEKEGYDISYLVSYAMVVYHLDPSFGVQVEYWSSSYGSFIKLDEKIR